MNVNGDTVIKPLGPTTGPKAVSVCAFATTATAQTGQINPVVYCGREIQNMNMLRPFHSSTAAPELVANGIDGHEVKPTVAMSMFQIARMAIDLVPDANETVASAAVYRTGPIRCRVTRVTPKLQAGITTSIDPTNDLFLNQVGATYGATDQSFTMSDAENARINTRVYTVVSDEKFTLEAAPSVESSGIINQGRYAQNVSRPEGQILARRTYYHQLASKKHGNVYYKNPDAVTSQNADSGHRREYIFMHFWYSAADQSTLAGTSALEPPGGSTDPVAGQPLVFQDLAVHLRTSSKFKDV